MKYDVDDLVSLEDGQQYYLIDKNELDGDTYYYAVLYDEDIDKMLDNEFCFFKADKDSLIDVVDLNIIEKLYEKFLNKVSI